ncbi:MAG: hypothetical protein K2Q18_19680 [Bdellovibrionales bacterium]|nr:hypothetical protein [Bdellovibrionales bacterium]
MKTLLLSFIFTCFSSSIYACEKSEIAFSKNNLCAKIVWLNGPALNNYGSLAVTLSDTTELKLNVIPWMVMGGGHEHGSRPVAITAQSSRDYLVEKIYFMGGMMGDWYLKFQLVNDKKEIVEEVRTLIEL